MMRFRLLLALQVLIVVVAGSAAAQTPPPTPKFEVVPIVGYRSGVKSPRGATPTHLLRTELGGIVLGAQVRGRLHRHLSAFATGAYSAWGDRPGVTPTDTAKGGEFRWLVGGLSLDITLKDVVPLSIIVAPGVIEERYAGRFIGGALYPAGRGSHQMVAFGAEALFPLRGRFLARGGVRDHLTWWDDAVLERSHIWMGYLGVGLHW